MGVSLFNCQNSSITLDRSSILQFKAGRLGPYRMIIGLGILAVSIVVGLIVKKCLSPNQTNKVNGGAVTDTENKETDDLDDSDTIVRESKKGLSVDSPGVETVSQNVFNFNKIPNMPGQEMTLHSSGDSNNENERVNRVAMDVDNQKRNLELEAKQALWTRIRRSKGMENCLKTALSADIFSLESKWEAMSLAHILPIFQDSDYYNEIIHVLWNCTKSIENGPTLLGIVEPYEKILKTVQDLCIEVLEIKCSFAEWRNSQSEAEIRQAKKKMVESMRNTELKGCVGFLLDLGFPKAQRVENPIASMQTTPVSVFKPPIEPTEAVNEKDRRHACEMEARALLPDCFSEKDSNRLLKINDWDELRTQLLDEHLEQQTNSLMVKLAFSKDKEILKVLQMNDVYDTRKKAATEAINGAMCVLDDYFKQGHAFNFNLSFEKRWYNWKCAETDVGEWRKRLATQLNDFQQSKFIPFLDRVVF